MEFIEIIKAFFGFMESDEEFWNKVKNNRYNLKKSLSQEEINYLNSLCFEECLDFTFKSIDKKNFDISIVIGGIVSLLAVITDTCGKSVEKKINVVEIKDFNGNKISIEDFDTGNAFDLKTGSGHREYIGHDFNFFKTIPGDFVVAKGQNAGKTLNEIIGLDKDTHTFFRFLKATYNLEGSFIDTISKIIKITSVHMLKDIVTPDGLPIPFSSIFTKFIPKLTNACGYTNTNELNKLLGDELGHIKFSDINSFVLIKALVNIYFKHNYKDVNLSKRAKKALKNQMYIVAMATTITMQLFIMLFGKNDKGSNKVNRGKVNQILLISFIRNCNQLMKNCSDDNKDILNVYKTRKAILGGVKMKYPMEEYNVTNDDDYYFENDDNNYVNRDILIKALNLTTESNRWKEKDIKQINSLFYMENLKVKLANSEISVEEFRNLLVTKLKQFVKDNNFSIFDETKAHDKFYKMINGIYKGEIE